MAKILIAEDDKEIAMLETDYLEIKGYEVKVIEDGLGIEQMLAEGSFDLLLLDVMLPGKDGYAVCREIRNKYDLPILMVTARTDSIDKIRGLGLGADDYIVKPFDPAELTARVDAHLARYRRLTGSGDEPSVIEAGGIRIMTESWIVEKNGCEIHMPNREFELLKFMASNPNIVFSKETLYERIWGYDYAGDSETVTVHVNRIREKLEDDPKKPKLIETIWGAGYRLNVK
jgi:Response regulators consisting of a CheY-like receiver domain and a winged-helix DNA-binding domain